MLMPSLGCPEVAPPISRLLVVALLVCPPQVPLRMQRKIGRAKVMEARRRGTIYLRCVHAGLGLFMVRSPVRPKPNRAAPPRQCAWIFALLSPLTCRLPAEALARQVAGAAALPAPSGRQTFAPRKPLAGAKLASPPCT